ncbi:MAG: cell division topological specificity factor MinE [Alteromonadaceae bacterium]|nr:MAG: cell division topological specificity factor MinE [Alteromonadaceae bacterium]
MTFFDYFANKKPTTASLAKERLQIIVAHERNLRNQPDYLPALQKEIMEVICRYVDVNVDDVDVQLDKNGNCSVLELNVTLPNTRN